MLILMVIVLTRSDSSYSDFNNLRLLALTVPVFGVFWTFNMSEMSTCEGASTLKSVRVKYIGVLRIRKIISNIGSHRIFIALYWTLTVTGLLLDSDEGSFVS